MRELRKLYIDGAWVEPVVPKVAEAINPATEDVSGLIAGGDVADVKRTVTAARCEFSTRLLR